MDHAKKMALVDPRKLESLQNAATAAVPSPVETIATPVTAALQVLDREMRDILNSPESYSEDEKVKRYNQTLQRYLSYKHQLLHPPPPSPQQQPQPVEDTKELEQDIVDSVPKKYQSKAKRMLAKLKKSDVISWSEDGQLKYQHQLVPNTNIGDLVNDAVRLRKRFEPNGWQVFARGLAESNVSQDLIGNTKRWNWIQEQRGVPEESYWDRY